MARWLLFGLLFIMLIGSSAADTISTNASGDTQPFNYAGVGPRALGQTFTLNFPYSIAITNISVNMTALGSAGTGWFEVYELNPATGLPTTTKYGTSSTFSVSSGTGMKIGSGSILVPAYKDIALIFNHSGVVGNPRISMSTATNPYAGGTGLNITDAIISTYNPTTYDFWFIFNYTPASGPGPNLTVSSASYSLRLLDFNVTAKNETSMILGTTTGSVTFGINSSVYNITVEQYTNATYINTTFNNVLGNQTLTFNYSVINISARTLTPPANIENFTTRLYNRDTELSLQNTATNNISIYYVDLGNYTVFFDAVGYISKAYNITLSHGVSSLQINTSPDNAVNLLFLDEITSVTQAGIVFDIINEAFSRRVSMGVNTSILLQSIPYGDYEFRYGLSNNSLQPRSFYISFPISVSNLTNITLRTINTSVSTLFIRNIVDATSQPMTGYVLDVQRFYTNGSGSTGAWETVAQTEIDQRGDAVFPAVPNTQAYRFRIVNGTSIIDTFSPSYLVDQSSNFISKGSGGVLSNFNTAQGIAYTSIRNTTSQLVFDYSSVAEISRICMDVLYEYRFNSSRVQACSNANSGTLASSIDANQNGTYTATVYANISGEIYTLDTIKFKPTGTNPRATFGKYGLIIWLVSMLVAAIIGGFVNPIPGLVFAVTATLAYAASFIGLISMSVTIAGGLLITVIIVLILFARRE